jgi:hypothetical protein
LREYPDPRDVGDGNPSFLGIIRYLICVACPVKAFSVPHTDLHDIIPNHLSMFKNEHVATHRRTGEIERIAPFDRLTKTMPPPPCSGDAL